MGITIHYTGSVERARLNEMLDAARFYCAEQRWAALEIEERIAGQVERFGQMFHIDDTMRGLLVTIHPESEPLRLTFNDIGEMVYYMALNDESEYLEYKSLFTGTRKASAHIALCEFFHWLTDTYMPGLHVYDEGGYFESGDSGKLARAFDGAYTAPDRLEETLEEMDDDDPRGARMRGVADVTPEEADGEVAAPRARKAERKK